MSNRLDKRCGEVLKKGFCNIILRLLGTFLGAQASLPACLNQSAFSGNLQAGMPALPGMF
jgi:hypothetical protein